MSERHGKREAREITEPAPTVTGKARSDEWVYDRRQGHTSGGGTDDGPQDPDG